MGPRSFERGDPSAVRMITTHDGPSMGPRSFERGDNTLECERKLRGK